ncbi:hypothetical protein NMG60_11006027 [Bertholletia excelsa]
MGRAPCCDKNNVKKGPWSPDEDAILKSYIEKHGTGGNWIALPQKIGLRRCGKSCRLRWLNYLRPNIRHGGFSEEEDNIICSLYSSIGSRWSIIAAQLEGRTDNDIKNYWNTRLKKKLISKRRKEQQENSLIKQEMNRESEPSMVSEVMNPITYCVGGQILDHYQRPYSNNMIDFQPYDHNSISTTVPSTSSLRGTCSLQNIIEGFNNNPIGLGELICNGPLEGSGSVSGIDMVNSGTCSSERINWGDMTNSLLYPSVFSGYEAFQRRDLPDYAWEEPCTWACNNIS